MPPRQVYVNITSDAGSGYREFPVSRVESYSVDQALDTDADSFDVTISDPERTLSFLLKRDNEIRARIFSFPEGFTDPQPILVGIADECEYTSDDGTLSISGRDLSCIAVDWQHPPMQWRKADPARIISNEARARGFSKLRIASTKTLSGVTLTDGGESYWEFWYRLARKSGMWIWTENDGTLVMDKLQYAASPSFFLGRPLANDPNPSRWIPIEQLRVTKSTKGRLGEVWVFGSQTASGAGKPLEADSKIGFVGKAADTTTKSWIRKPLKMLESTKAKNVSDAIDEANDEIFDSKIGALEIEVTFQDAGQIVAQNSMVQVNIPLAGFYGIFFAVSSRLEGSTDGYHQVVRLREKGFALSRRVPDDPEFTKDPGDQTPPGSVAAGLTGDSIRWANAFTAAAQEFHDGWSFTLFLGVLLALCDKETGFRNVREGNSGLEWYPKPAIGFEAPTPRGGSTDKSTQENWMDNFANSAGNPRNHFGREAGVGPMQLTTLGFKEWADAYGGKNDEYSGGRWIPEDNIRAGARAFAGKLYGLNPSKDEDIWIGVEAWNGAGAAAHAYMLDVRHRYLTKFKALVEQALAGSKQLPNTPQDTYNVVDENGNPFQVQLPDEMPMTTKKAILYALKQLGKPYVWGAEGPSAFDCSGLVYAAFRSAGYMTITRTTYTMFKQFTPVPKNDLRPGDLVFFDDLDHMGMYLNDNHFIQAPHTGDVVKISSLTGSYHTHYDGARRVISWGAHGYVG